MALSDLDQENIRTVLGRAPSDVELSIFDTMWSEHCSYKSSKPVLKTLPTKGPNIMLGVGEDSGIIEFATHNGHAYGIAVSHESHNHPSQVLPVEGAATGVGGVVRDVYCMGADVIGTLNSLHFGIASDEDPNSFINHVANHVVKGIADYGNPLGVPNCGGETIYHESYNENCLVNVAAIGLVRDDHIIRSKVPEAARHAPYVMILIGKTTDSTGYGGASFSSAVLDSEDEQQNLGAVQVHDPFMKRVLVVAIADMLQYVHKNGIDIGFKDLGAGGISCATSELAVAGGFGCELNLNHVPVVDPKLSPEIIACSETQERFCVVVPEHHAEAICAIFNKKHNMGALYPGAGAAVIGCVTHDSVYKIKHNGVVICELPVSAITTEVLAPRTSTPRPLSFKEDELPKVPLLDVAMAMLAHANNTQKKYVYRNFDQFVKNNGVVIPGEADACVLQPIDGCDAGVAVTMDSNTYGESNPYVAGAYAVAESIRNVIAVGATPIALTDCLNYGNPENPDVFFDFEEGVRGIGDAAKQLGPSSDVVPIISGNVSFYNESATGQAVVPSPVICCIGNIPNAQDAHRMQLSHVGAHLLLIGQRYKEMAHTQYELALKHLGIEHAFKTVPQVRFSEEKSMNQAMLRMNQEGLSKAVHDISQGGMWQTVVEMMAGDRNWPFVGIQLNCPSDIEPDALLFSENAGYLCEILPNQLEKCHDILTQYQVPFWVVGQTNSSDGIAFHLANQCLFDVSSVQVLKAFNSKNLVTPGTPIYNESLKES